MNTYFEKQATRVACLANPTKEAVHHRLSSTESGTVEELIGKPFLNTPTLSSTLPFVVSIIPWQAQHFDPWREDSVGRARVDF